MGVNPLHYPAIAGTDLHVAKVRGDGNVSDLFVLYRYDIEDEICELVTIYLA